MLLGIVCASSLAPVLAQGTSLKKSSTAKVTTKKTVGKSVPSSLKKPSSVSKPVQAKTDKKIRKKKAVPSSKPASSSKKQPIHESAVELKNTLHHLLEEAAKKASVGIKVVHLTNEMPLFEKNADQFFKPASTTKLFTAAAAYHILGADYRCRTQLYTDKKINAHTINNLYIKGGADPSLTTQDIISLVKQLKNHRIRTIQGDIIIDDSILDPKGPPPGRNNGDGPIFDKAPIGSLMVNHSCVRVQVKPARHTGKKPVVIVDHVTPFTRIQNSALTTTRPTKNTLHVLRGEQNEIIVKGSIKRLSSAKHYRFAVEGPTRYTGQVFAGVVKSHNLTYKGKIIFGKVPQGATFLVEHASEPVSTLIHHLMKSSDNLYSDALFTLMGAHQHGIPGTWHKGELAVKEFLTEVAGIDIEGMKLYDGSGLSHKNQISPEQLISLLTWVYTSSPDKESFISSLPIGGVDGTLRTRMAHKNPHTKVLAKTGSLRGVSSLAGFITPKDGHPLIFAIMINRDNKSAVMFKRQLEDQLCALLSAHAFSTEPV